MSWIRHRTLARETTNFTLQLRGNMKAHRTPFDVESTQGDLPSMILSGNIQPVVRRMVLGSKRTWGYGQWPPIKLRNVARRRRWERASKSCAASTKMSPPSSPTATSTLPPPTGAGSAAHDKSTIRPSLPVVAGDSAPCRTVVGKS